jgi:UDP-N-acetylglucosamine diphosphorylase/glucosamine-1-phosphate N-acetyltransferase
VIKLKAVILAAGEGRRCRPLTQTRSKVMLPVGNKPFMEHVILALAANGVKELFVVVGYQKERIMNHFEDGVHYGVELTYIEQKELLGTAHALGLCKSFIEEDFLVVNGDNLVDEKAIQDLIFADGQNVILAVLKSHAGDYGVLTVEQERVKRIIEKPGRPCSGILNTGAYRFSPQIFDELPKTPISLRGSYELTQTVTQMIDEGIDVRAKIAQGSWADAIFSWDLLNANSIALNLMKPKTEGEIEEGARIRGQVEIGKGTIIRSGCYITGPVSIGRNCDIGPNVTILPATSIAESVRIGSNSELRNSIVMNGTRIGSGAIISDSIIGASNTVGDQTITETGANVVDIEDVLYRAEFGAILADNNIVGNRVLMNPGAIVGANSKIGSAASVRGWIDKGSRVT